MTAAGDRPLTWWEVTLANGGGPQAPRRIEVMRGEDEVQAGTLAIARARWASRVTEAPGIDPWAWRVVRIRPAADAA